MHVRRFYYHHAISAQYIEVDASCLVGINLPMRDAKHLISVVWEAALAAKCYYRKIVLNQDNLYNKTLSLGTHDQVDTEDRFYHVNQDKTFKDMVQYRGHEANCEGLVLSQEYSRKGGEGAQMRVVLMQR